MGVWSRFVRTIRSGRHTDDIDEELQFHLEMDMADGRDRRAARLRLGNVARIREETRAAGVLEWLDSAFRDARYGLRQVSRAPALALAVVLSLAIGIGANTAIFSLVDAAILRPLPVHDAGALRIVVWTSDAFPKNAENINGNFRRISPTRFEGSSIPAYLYRRLAREQTVFQSLIGVADADAVAAALDAAPAEQVNLQYVSSNFFQALGTLPVIGRAFRDDEDRVDAQPVVVVSHRFWVRHFGGGPLDQGGNSLDSGIRINNVPAHIVGVAPTGFFGLRAGEWTDVYAPFAAKVAFRTGQASGAPRVEDDQDWWVQLVARLKPDVSEEAARTQIAGQFRFMAAPEGATVKANEIPELREPRPGGILERARRTVCPRVRDELTRLPGVARVSLVATRLLSGNGNNGRMNIPGALGTTRIARISTGLPTGSSRRWGCRSFRAGRSNGATCILARRLSSSTKCSQGCTFRTRTP